MARTSGVTDAELDEIDITVILDDIAADGDDEVADLRDRYWWWAITHTRQGWTAAPIWLDGVRIDAATAAELEQQMDAWWRSVRLT